MENTEIVKVVETNIAPVSEPLFDIQIATAKKYPRNVIRVIDNAIATVTRNENVAASCGYALPRAGKQIQGASVHLARIIAQFYGNIRVQVKAGEVGSTHVTASAIAFDLESNYAIQVDARRKILKRDGKRYDEDMINTTMLAAMAVAERNAIYKVIPQALIDEVYQASRKKLTGDLSDEQKLITKRKEVLDFFLKNYDVSEVDILEMFGKKTVAQITPDDIATLRGVVQAVKDGDTTIDEQFPRFKKEVNKEENKKLFDAKTE